MRAVHLPQTRQSGEPRIVERPDPPEPTGSSILVDVAASSINGTDLGLRRGGLAGLLTRRVAPGFDIAGEVIACGPRVTAFEIGDRVMALLPHSGGGQAELVSVGQQRAARIPDSIPIAVASAMPLAGLTALQALRDCGRLRHGGQQRVLINGAAGGIGSFAVQLAKHFGAHVTAITSGPRRAFLADLGADEILDRHGMKVTALGRRFDLVLDVPSAFRFADVSPVLLADGVLVSTRPISPDTLRALNPSRRPAFRAVTTSASSQDLSYLAHLVETGRLTVPIDQVFPAEHVADGYAKAESGTVSGKVVITF